MISKELEHLTTLAVPVLSILVFSSHSNNIISDFSYLVVSQYITILIPKLTVILILALGTSLVFRLTKKKSIDPLRKVDSRMVFDMSRFLTITQTTICIFLCDFNFWNPRFSKNDYFSIGLMDLGVGCFVFNGGVLSSKIPVGRLARSTLMLFFLGLVRFFVVKTLSMDVNPNEYGFHWNFYFTLAVVNFLFILINRIIPRKIKSIPWINFVIGSSLLMGYESQMPWIIETVFIRDRSSVFLMNKEGVLSVVPFLGFFLILNCLGKYILEKNIINQRKYLFRMWVANAIIYLLSQARHPSSRRICNVSYLSWILVIQFTFMLVFATACNARPEWIGDLRILRLISQSMLDIFLGSNLLVLFFKMVFETMKMGYLQGNALNLVYLLISLIVIPIIRQKSASKLKRC